MMTIMTMMTMMAMMAMMTMITVTNMQHHSLACCCECFTHNMAKTQVRKITMDENPGVKFGEISRIVAERWRGMSDADKQVSGLHDLFWNVNIF